MTKFWLMLLIFSAGQIFGQKNIFRLSLQNKNELIEFGSSGKYYGYTQWTKINDSVKVERKKYLVAQIDRFLDSMQKIGYKDKAPKEISKTNYECKLKILNFKYFDHDTLKDKSIDSIFIIDVGVTLNYPKLNISKTYNYPKLYTHYSKSKLEKLFATYKDYNLEYFSRSNIYKLKIDFDFSQYTDRFRGGFQPGDLAEEIDF